METTSTYSVGKRRTKETRNLNLVYSGTEADVWLAFDQVWWLVAEYKLDLSKASNVRDTLYLASQIFESLKAKGIKYLYCTADSETAFRFNEHLGFETVNVVFKDRYEVMEKEL